MWAVKKIFSLIIISLLLIGCGGIRNIPKYSFSDGHYRSKVFNNKKSTVYVDNSEDSITVYQLVKNKNGVKETNNVKMTFPQQKSGTSIPTNNFKQSSFDLDFITIPFKFRPLTRSMPQQFNTNLNGAMYVGYRNDVYNIKYKKTPIKKFVRQTHHYGFSFGFFTGLGGAAMNQWVTNYNISSEYDGVVWNKGAAAIIGIDNFSIGLAVGFDYLTDKNQKYWIYQDKPWFGLAFGLNLN